MDEVRRVFSIHHQLLLDDPAFLASKIIQIASIEAKNKTKLSLRQAFELLEPEFKPPFDLTIPDQQQYAFWGSRGNSSLEFHVDFLSPRRPCISWKSSN